MMDIIAKCSVCGRGYIAIFSDEVSPCLDHLCPGYVERLSQPVPRSEWRDPDKKLREARKATAPPREGAREDNT